MKINYADSGTQPVTAGDLNQFAHRELAAGVLKQAGQDLRRYHDATGKLERKLFLDAYRWLTVDECSSPFSFLNVCQLLNLTPDDIRHELMDDFSLGAFGHWVRRCGRTVRSLRSSFSELFAGKPSDHIEPKRHLPQRGLCN